MLQASTSPRPLSVTYRAAGSLKPDPRNARTHPKRQVDQIITSMRKFGFTNPILVDPDGMIIAGHGRGPVGGPVHERQNAGITP